MSGMVERVQAAIMAATDQLAWSEAYHLARAAIKAMREPTQEMIDAVYLSVPTEGEIIMTWEAMIDAALITEN